MATRRPPQLMKVTEYQARPNFMIYADPGAGKTVWCGDADLIIASEAGLESAKAAGSAADMWVVNGWEDIEAAYDYLSKEKPTYKVIALDGSTAAQRLAHKWWMEKVEKDNTHRDQDLPGMQEHQKIQNIIKRYHELYCALPYVTVFTAQVMTTENNAGDERLLPYIHGQKGDLSRYICGLMSNVGYMEVRELQVRNSDTTKEVRRIHWQPYQDGTYIAKDRFAALGKFTTDKSLPEVLAMIQAGDKAPAKPTVRRTAVRRTRRVS